MPEFTIYPALPTLVPAVFGLLLLLFVTPRLEVGQRWLWVFSLVAMALSAAIPAIMLGKIDAYGGVLETAGVAGLPMITTDRLALTLDVLFGIAGVLALLITPQYLDNARAHRGEIYPLMLIAVSGMTAMAGTQNLLMIFIGLEVLSISLYVMCGLARERSAPIEAALKYFLLGAFSTAFLVYGIALVLGATGHLDLPGIAAALRGFDVIVPYGKPMLLAGLAMILVAFAFKVGAVPFHFWAPDVYQRAPRSVVAFVATTSKLAAIGVVLRVVSIASMTIAAYARDSSAHSCGSHDVLAIPWENSA